jgi:hypothetical protein
MEDSQNRKLDTFNRVRGFGTRYASDFAPTSTVKQWFTSLAEIIDELTTHASTKVSGGGKAKEGTSTRAVGRAALRETMELIARAARAMSDDVPGLDDKFRMPRGSNDQNLLAVARAFAEDASPLSAEFIKHEFPADFLTDLRSEIADLEGAISHQSDGVGSRISAGAAIDETVERGVAIVKKLDSAIRTRYRDNPAVLAEWTSASHTERGPKRRLAASSGSGPTEPPLQ